MKRARQEKTLAEKIELLNRFKDLPTLSQREAAERLGVSRGFLQNLLKNEAALCAEDRGSKSAKRKRFVKDQDVEDALYEWFVLARSINVPINGPVLIETANNIAATAGRDGFKATDGWLTRWKKRNGVKFTTMRDGAAEAETSGTEDFLNTVVADLLKTCSPEVICAGTLENDSPNQVPEDGGKSDDEAMEPTPTAAEMRQCLHRLGVGLKRMGFGDLGDFYAFKNRVTEELREKCPETVLICQSEN